ncbi:hypothetical protein ACOSQ2_013273 [Xanthoceras sorbifolium]
MPSSAPLYMSFVPPVSFVPELTIIHYVVKLNRANFSLWSQVVETFVVGRGKLGYLTGRIQAPSSKDVLYEKWSMDNALVKGWLIRAMEPDVMNLFISLPTTKAIWDVVSQTYFDRAY